MTTKTSGTRTTVPGSSSILMPLIASTVASAPRRRRSGTLTVNWLVSRTPGIEPNRSHIIARRSTFPATRWPIPATQSRAAAWKMSVPTIFEAVSG